MGTSRCRRPLANLEMDFAVIIIHKEQTIQVSDTAKLLIYALNTYLHGRSIPHRNYVV